MASNTTTLWSNGEKAGEFPKMLWEMLQYLEHQKRPLYKGSKEKLTDREEWHVHVLIYTRKPKRDGAFKVEWTIQASGVWSTFHAGIRDAACQAMYRVRDNCAHLLSNTRYRYFPHRRVSNTEKKICRSNEHQISHDPELAHQIRFTKAIDAFCDEALDELRETRFKLREREKEALCGGHNAMNNGDQGVSVGGPSSGMSDAALPQDRGDCHRRLAIGAIVNENSVSSGAGGSSCIISGANNDALPQSHRNRPRPPSTQQSFVMHPMAATKPTTRRGRAPSSSHFEGRVRGKKLMPFISDAGVALGKKHGSANSSSSSSSNNNKQS